jgi:hypothetical protein
VQVHVLTGLVPLCVVVICNASLDDVRAFVGLGVREPAEPMLVILVYDEILSLVRVVSLGVRGVLVVPFHVDVCLVGKVFVAELARNQHAVQTGIGWEIFSCRLGVLGDFLKFVDRTCRAGLEMLHVFRFPGHNALFAPRVP